MLAVFFATLAAAVPQPTIVQKPIPFPKVRKEQMAAYSRRHYGIDSYRLRNPKVIVEHYTVTSSFQPVVEHLRRQHARQRAGRAAGHLRALRDRP